VIMVPGILELDLTTKPQTIHQTDHRARPVLARVA
jgi:hypothetical protein